MCFTTLKQMSSAAMNNDGDQITVTLSTQAETFNAPCDELFDEATSTLLGEASCQITNLDRNSLVISLQGDARIDPSATDDTRKRLTLKANNPLRDFLQPTLGYDASVSILVSSCGDNCTAPTAKLSGPTSVKEPCNAGDTYQTIYIDSSESIAPSGRALSSRTWGTSAAVVDGMQCTAASDALQAAVDRANTSGIGSTGAMSLELDTTVLESLSTSSTYCITLSVTSYLGRTSNTDAVHFLTKQGADSGTPAITILAPASTTLSSGLTLSGSVAESSICSGDVAEYKWECISTGCPLLNSPASFLRSVTRDLQASDLVGSVTAGSTLTFRLSARFVGSVSEASATQDVAFIGDAMTAAFTEDSSAGSVSRGSTLKFDASPSRDPSDPTNTLQPMRYIFACVHPDGISSCFTSTEGYYYGNMIDGSTWELDSEKFVDVAEGEVFTISVTIKKGSGESERKATATSIIQLMAADTSFVSARVEWDCGATDCSGTALSNDDLSFFATILNVDAFGASDTISYRWTVNGNTVLKKHLSQSEGSSSPDDAADASIITLNRFRANDNTSIIPRSGALAIKCEITVQQQGANPATGSAWVSLDLLGPPICSRGDGGCLLLPTTSIQYPTVQFRAEARDFSSSNPLTYEFGFIIDGEQTVSKAATLKSAQTLSAEGGTGTYTVYAVAVDSRTSARSLAATASFSLNPAEVTGATCQEREAVFTQLVLDAASGIDVTSLVNSGSTDSVFGGMNLVNALGNGVFPEDCGSRRLLSNEEAGRRHLLNLGDSAVLGDSLAAVLGTLASRRTPDALGALNSVQSTFSLDKPPAVEQAKTLAQVVTQSLEILAENNAADVGTNIIAPAVRNQGLANEVLVAGCGDDCGDEHTPWLRTKRVMDALVSARLLLHRIATSGRTTTAVSVPMTQGVSRNTRTATSTANVGIDVSVMRREGMVQASAQLQGGSARAFLDWCASNPACSGRSFLTFSLSFVRDAATYTSTTSTDLDTLISAHFADASEGPTVVSGVLEAQFEGFKADGDHICSATTKCTMDLRIPINGGVDTSRKKLSCVRLAPDTTTQSFVALEVQSSIPLTSSGSHAVCPTDQLGLFMVMAYTPAPAPSPSPSPSSSVNPPPPPANPVQASQPSPLPEIPTVQEVAERFNLTCSANEQKLLRIFAELGNVDSLTTLDIQTLQKRLQKNLDSFLRAEGGLKCPLKLMLGNGRRRALKALTVSAEADLGEETPGADVAAAKRKVSTEMDAGNFQQTFVNGEDGSFVTQSGVTVTVSDASIDEGTPGCSALRDKLVTADIVVNGATDNFKLTPAIANELAAAIHKKADELVEDIQINCPVQVEIMSDASTSPASWSRRYLLSDHNIAAVIIDLGDDASSETVRTVLDTLRNSDALGSVAGYQVSYSWNAGTNDGSSGTNASVLGPAIAIPVFVFIAAVILVVYMFVKQKGKGSDFNPSGNAQVFVSQG
uniref:Uncharacterized protein n=2 Tax=Dunaliella tertiolecta TaxID=3047 RepID=A0A6S8JH13_DUNTE|mmetsp:Transcript_12295/g.33567  ORF Transcript_12295/g.33567 Transcript_12295/m.33567 type:complete len:1468 (+) Transcript_12295:2059-6462(+)